MSPLSFFDTAHGSFVRESCAFFTKILLAGLLGILLLSCQKQPDHLPVQDYTVVYDPLRYPAHFRTPPDNPQNPLRAEVVQLGKVLFFDKALSKNNQVSCATCHQPEKAFADGLALGNIGVSGNPLHRHSPALINLAWATQGLFWDGGATNLESISIAPLTHPDEMAQDILLVPEKLLKNSLYKTLFANAFPNEKKDIPSIQQVLKALAQYMRTLHSANSRYDRFILNPKANPLTALEKKGMNIFDKKCATCHTRSDHLFTDHAFHNNGLDKSFSNDHEGIAQGRYRITGNPDDMGKFKTPTLRNLLYTAPYMHDGRFATLQEVLDHYSSGIQSSASLHPLLAQGYTLSETDKDALLAFLNTLNDPSFILQNTP
jgi:cytochrome c peroxidase